MVDVGPTMGWCAPSSIDYELGEISWKLCPGWLALDSTWAATLQALPEGDVRWLDAQWKIADGCAPFRCGASWISTETVWL